MLILERGEKESIDRLLKRYKKKARETRLIKDIRAKKEYIKPSAARRKQLQKAIYQQEQDNLLNSD